MIAEHLREGVHRLREKQRQTYRVYCLGTKDFSEVKDLWCGSFGLASDAWRKCWWLERTFPNLRFAVFGMTVFIERR